MRLAIALLLLAAPAFAADPHAHELTGGWWECDRGYVSKPAVGGAVCVSEDQANEGKFEVSSLPSAGDGSRVARSCPSGGCAAPVAQTQPVDDGSFVTRSGWLYTPGNSAFYGGTLSRAGIGSRTVISLPPPW